MGCVRSTNKKKGGGGKKGKGEKKGDRLPGKRVDGERWKGKERKGKREHFTLQTLMIACWTYWVFKRVLW